MRNRPFLLRHPAKHTNGIVIRVGVWSIGFRTVDDFRGRVQGLASMPAAVHTEVSHVAVRAFGGFLRLR
jgi:hypothetical protein